MLDKEELIKYLTQCHRIPEHPNYAVNRMGSIYNIDKKTKLKPIEDSQGYLRVRLDGKRELVSRLVAKKFVENPDNKPNVRYKDGNRRNVKFDNLEWATNSEIKRPDKNKRIT